MKISKRIFSLLVSLLVITSSVGVATATETTETTEEFKHIDISSSLDSSTIGKAGDEAGDNWFGGLTEYEAHNEFGGLIQFGTSTDTLIFNEYKNEVDTGRKIETSFPKERKLTENKDSVLLKPNSANELKLDLDSRSTEKLYFVGHSNGSTLNLKITYSDGTVQEENFTAIYSNQSWYNGIKGTHQYPNVISTGATSYNNLKKGEDGKLAPVSENSTPGNGLTLYGIEMDKDKIPKSVTFSNAGTNAKRIIFIYAVTQDFFTNADMQSVIDEVKAYETGIAYTTAQIEKIELAKEYADVLKERNALSTEDEKAVNSFYTVAVKQKDMAGTIHLDISDKLNASTIGTANDTAGDNWLGGIGVENSTHLTFFASYFKSDYVTLNGITLNRGATSADDKGPTQNGKTYTAYIPQKRAATTENDSVLIPYNDGTVTFDVNEVITKSLDFVLAATDNFNFKIKVNYTDGTSHEYNPHLNAYSQITQYSRAEVIAMTSNFGYSYLKKNDSNTLESISGDYHGLALYSVTLDEEKIPESVIFTNSNTSGGEARSVFLYAINQNPVTYTEMTTAIETAKTLNEKTGMLTSDEIQTIKNANNYASILVDAGVGTASDYAFLDTLFAKAQKQKAISGVTHFDISDKYNADTIASAGDTVGDSWFDGYTGLNRNNVDGLPKSKFGDTEIFTAKKYTYNEGWSSTYDEVEFYIPNVGRNGGENDAFALWNKNSEVRSLEVDLNDVCTKEIRFVANNTEATVKATVYYKDGTTATSDIGGTNYASSWYSTYNDKAAYWGIGQYVARKTENEVLTNTLELVGSVTSGLMVWYVETDETKVVDKVVFTNSSTSKPVFFYGISQVPVTYTEMSTALETSLENGVLTDEDEAQAELLAKYKSIFVDCGACKATDYLEVEAYTKQANAQKTSYVDLTDYLNADLMVKAGDTYEENNTLARETVLFDGSNLTGTLTVNTAPSKSYAPDADQNEIGRTYKLSGAYNGKGNDVVQVKKDDENVKTVTIAMPETIGTVKGIGVILDCYTGAGGAEDATKSYATKVPVTVNYEGGTSEDVTVNLLNSEGYHYSKFYANAGKTGRMDLETGTIGNSKNGQSGFNSPFFYSSNVEFDTEKTVESLTFKSISGGDYNIVAISQFVQSNAELQGIVDSYSENEDITGITEVSEVTEENADDVIKFFGSIVELSNRGFAGFEEDVESFESLVARAKALKNGDTGFTATVTIATDGEKQKATFTMSNLTNSDQTYVLVIAAYVGNKLVGVEASDTEKTVTAGATNVTDSISMAKSTESGVTYKAFVWESLTSLKPLGTSN